MLPLAPDTDGKRGIGCHHIFGGVLTDTGPWNRSLKKPDWQPPGWLFAPAWTIIYIHVDGAGRDGHARRRICRTRRRAVAAA